MRCRSNEEIAVNAEIVKNAVDKAPSGVEKSAPEGTSISDRQHRRSYLAPVSVRVPSEQEKRVQIPLKGLERLYGAVCEK
jgi:hypothetical protein